MADESRCCALCGLPAPWGNHAPGEPVFCCYGCRLAAQIQGTGDAGELSLFARLGIAIFFAMNVMAFTMALWTHEVYGPETTHRIEAPLQSVFRWLTFIFSLPVYYLLGVPLAESCWSQLRNRAGAADLLLLVGVIAAFLASLPAIVLDQGAVYFEVGVLVLVFVTLGRWLEARCKQQATQALDELDRLLPEKVTCEREGALIEKPLDAAAIGDVLVVRAAERVPCDGVVLRAAATIDEQIWTGESTPHEKRPGMNVLAGSVNLAGDLYLCVSARAHDGALARLAELVHNARLARGHYQCLAERMSRVLLPLVVVVAVAAAAVHGIRSGFEAGLLAGLAVVLIACPCALGIATPLAVWAALGSAARRGIVFQSGDILERLAGVRAILFDKTGTLTEGRSHVVAVAVDFSTSVELFHEIAGGLAAASHHPCSRAIAASTSLGCSEHAKPPVSTHAGLGLEATWPFASGATTVRLGSAAYLEAMGAVNPPPLAQFVATTLSNGQAVVGVAWAGQVRGWFAIAEELRPEARGAIRRLKDDGIDVRILTGDQTARAARLAAALEIPVDAELKPAGKWDVLRQTRERFGPVAMVGDGVNDGPALAGADVGFALGCGTDLARASAGVCLLGDDLEQIPAAIELSRRTVRTIKANLFWAVAYNIVGVGIAAAGWLNPVIAAAVMVISSLFVIGNSSRLTREEPRRESVAIIPPQPEAA